MTGLDTDPDELLRAADRISDQARRVRESAGGLAELDRSGPAAGAPDHSRGYRQSLRIVGGRLHRHAEELEGLAQRLRAAATSYRGADSAAAARFRGIADELR